MDTQLAVRMNDLFKGLTSAHGVFIPERMEGKKQTGKCGTVREPVIIEKWQEHLNGKIGLGIIPIDEQNQCNWACIDVDVYDLNYKEIIEKLANFPFVICRSKSGGVHLFLFFKKPAMCRDVREYLRNQVSALGLGNSEIFPKQDEVIAKRGDIGNWLNMPYFGNTRRCIILDKHQGVIELALAEFLRYAENHKVEIEDVVATGMKIDYEKSTLVEGPPCLQTLSLKEFPLGSRNISLFNIGVYCKKAFPMEWQRKVEMFNKTLFREPLLSREVLQITKSLDKKDYFYQCYEEPLCSYCNAKLCRTRKYGISGATSMPIINSVTKVSGDFSIWFIDVEGGRLELTTEELFDHRKFLMKCVNSLNTLPNKMNPIQWTAFLQGIIDKAVVLTDENMFKRHEVPEQFYMFIMSRVTEKPEEIAQGRVVYLKERKEIQFKMESFLNYMRYKKVQIDKGWIVMYFKTRGVRNGVGKDKDRKSYRYSSLSLSNDEALDVEQKLRMGNVV